MSRDKGIKVSENHGLNPSISKCFFCGKDKGIVFIGKLPGDAEAPKACIVDYQPCDHCLSLWNKGVAIIGAVTEPPTEDSPPAQVRPDGAKLYPTGQFVVLKVELAEHIFDMPEMYPGLVLLADQVILDELIAKAEDDKAVIKTHSENRGTHI